MATDGNKDRQKHSIEILLAGYIGGDECPSTHDKGERLVPRTVRRIKAINVDKDRQ
jgi:hypothetical protein